MGSGEAVQSLAAILRWGESDLEGGEGCTAGSPKFQGGIKSRVPLVAKKVMKILVLGKSDQGQSCSEFHAEFGGFCLFLS